MDKLEIKDYEIETWKDIISKIYYPYDDSKKIFLQQLKSNI